MRRPDNEGVADVFGPARRHRDRAFDKFLHGKRSVKAPPIGREQDGVGSFGRMFLVLALWMSVQHSNADLFSEFPWRAPSKQPVCWPSGLFSLCCLN